MSELSERLVGVAHGEIVSEAYAGDCADWYGAAESAAVAVLRELAATADGVEMALSWDLYLTDLADEIEAS